MAFLIEMKTEVKTTQKQMKTNNKAVEEEIMKAGHNNQTAKDRRENN